MDTHRLKALLQGYESPSGQDIEEFRLMADAAPIDPLLEILHVFQKMDQALRDVLQESLGRRIPQAHTEAAVDGIVEKMAQYLRTRN